jgi:hypothetical protein
MGQKDEEGAEKEGHFDLRCCMANGCLPKKKEKSRE